MKEKKKNWDQGYDLKLVDLPILFHFSRRECKSQTKFQLKI